jgi:large subunit ribosomal protein L21
LLAVHLEAQMYAVFESGGKQYRVSPGDLVSVERVDAPVGYLVEFDKVMMVKKEDGVVVAGPSLREARVIATVVRQGKGPKVRIFKMKRRKGFRRKAGHRQGFTSLLVNEIRV